MATKRVTDLTALTGANSDTADEFLIWDASAGTHKKITRAELVEALVAGGMVKTTGASFSGTVYAPNFFVGTASGNAGGYGVGGNSGPSIVFWGTTSPGAGDIEFYDAGVSAWKLKHTSMDLLPVGGTVNVGSGTYRVGTYYGVVGAINTSDRTEKQDIVALLEQPAMRAFFLELARSVRLFRFIASVQEKGDAARIHAGWIAQEVIEIADRHGVDALAHGFVGFDRLMVKEEVKVTETRVKTRRISVEVVSETTEADRIVISRETVPQDVPVMRTLPVYEGGRKIGDRLVPETEDVEVAYFRDVPGDKRRYNVRMDQLLAGCIGALAGEMVA